MREDCKNSSQVNDEHGIRMHCNVNNHTNLKVFLEIKQEFERLHPRHTVIPNNECPFFYTRDMEECPFYQKR